MTEKIEQQNGVPINRVDEHLPPMNLAMAQQQQMLQTMQQNTQQIVANMQEMLKAMNLSENVFGSSLDVLGPIQAFAQLQGQHFEMHETVTYTIQD